jgi:hypothetical protein
MKIKNVPLQQFQNMVDIGSTWHLTPGKQQWAEWELFRRERLRCSRGRMNGKRSCWPLASAHLRIRGLDRPADYNVGALSVSGLVQQPH